MTKEQAFDLIRLLSALEAWSFSNIQRLPDDLLEDLGKAVDVLSVEVQGWVPCRRL